MDHSGSEQNDEELDPGGQEVPEPESSLSKITHNALENIGVLGQGLKQLFIHQRRRASVSPHDAGSSPSASSAGTLNRVLLQIRGAPMMKRGTSLQSRRSKAAGDPPKGSPQIHRRSTQEALIQVGRPRSSSTTDTPTSPALAEVLLASGYPSAEEPERDFSQGRRVSTQSDSILFSWLSAGHRRSLPTGGGAPFCPSGVTHPGCPVHPVTACGRGLAAVWRGVQAGSDLRAGLHVWHQVLKRGSGAVCRWRHGGIAALPFSGGEGGGDFSPATGLKAQQLLVSGCLRAAALRSDGPVTSSPQTLP
ncbi:hypothetical protein ANANG_G00223990 [Anguilla anguilla]|uniref:Uncharacterized protein n=1 Tax=Anguilla anguilla TaxID=7936 RepID=A0A9D3RQD2_ANGAN|nr:hypothetical protein ANANG_G00223990 [Anguilla anguilla]